MLNIAFVSTKAVTDQEAAESQVGNAQVAQQRTGYDYTPPLLPEIEHHDHHHEEHDPGFWKKKLIWKEGWKKTWKEGKQVMFLNT